MQQTTQQKHKTRTPVETKHSSQLLTLPWIFSWSLMAGSDCRYFGLAVVTVSAIMKSEFLAVTWQTDKADTSHNHSSLW